MLATLSLTQALSIWSDLEKAYSGEASHGDTTELYLYRFMPWQPSVATAKAGAASGTGMMAEACREAYDNANGALHDLLVMFQASRPCHVEIDGRELGEWLKEARFEHRVGVKVTRTEKPSLAGSERDKVFRAGWEAAEAAAAEKLHENPRFEALDYVFIPEKDGRYRVEHSYYGVTNGQTHYTAEEALSAMRTCASFNLYAVVAFKTGSTLERRKK